ncbi:MAG: hypothetical protein QOJ29_3931, partial [Thermoleophilaceae bacterium]|nr:hypothetical protein [Thermoleophilaceae bacterium]
MSVATQNVVATLRDVGGDLATSRGVVPEKTADGLLWRVPPGEAFSLRLPLTAEGQSHFAVSATVCVSNWDELVRVDLEADSGSKTYRTGAKHLIQGRWHELRLDSSSLAFGIANGWSPALPAIDTVSLHVLGTAAAETTFALRDLTVEVFDASDAVPRLLVDDELESLDDILSWYPAITGRSSDPVLQDYVFVREYKTLDADAVRLAEAMRSRSEYELRSVTTPVKVGPDGEPEGTPSASWRFGWQSLDMCFALVRAFKATRDHGYLMLAIDHVDSWLAANIGNEPVDDYYGWYDHGVALRALAMLTVVDVAIEERVDAERVAPLIRAIRDHSELLANESFNGFNQSQHFHNHTLFQAVSLLFVARNQLGFAESQRWSAVAEQRILDQLNGLLSSEGVAIENS